VLAAHAAFNISYNGILRGGGTLRTRASGPDCSALTTYPQLRRMYLFIGNSTSRYIKIQQLSAQRRSKSATADYWSVLSPPNSCRALRWLASAGGLGRGLETQWGRRRLEESAVVQEGDGGGPIIVGELIEEKGGTGELLHQITEAIPHYGAYYP
jgi:hypothetical protein